MGLPFGYSAPIFDAPSRCRPCKVRVCIVWNKKKRNTILHVSIQYIHLQCIFYFKILVLLFSNWAILGLIKNKFVSEDRVLLFKLAFQCIFFSLEKGALFSVTVGFNHYSRPNSQYMSACQLLAIVANYLVKTTNYPADGQPCYPGILVVYPKATGSACVLGHSYVNLIHGFHISQPWTSS